VYEGSNYKIRYSISGLGTASSTGGGAWSVETASSDVTLLTNMSTFSVNGPGTYDINYLAATDNLLEGSWNYQHYLRLTINGTTYTLASPTVTLNDSNLGAFSLTVGLVGNLKQNDLLSISVTAPQNASRAAMFYWKIVNVTGIDSSDFWATSGTFDIWSGTTYGNISIGTTITGRTDTRQFKVQILNGSYYGAVLAETAVISFDTSEFSATLDFCDRSVGSAPYTAITQVQEGQTFSLRLSITGIGTYATNSSYLNYSGSTTATDPTQWTTRPSYFTYGAEPTSYVDMKLTDDSVTESPSNVIISMTIGNLTVTSTTLSVIDVPAIVANIYVFTRKVGGVDWDPGSYSYLYIPSGGDTVFNVAIQNYPFSTIQWSLYNQGQIGNTYGPTVEDFTDPNPAFNYVLGGINLEYFNEIKHTINLTVDSYDPTIKNGIINISTAINEKTPIFVGSTSGSTLTVSSISSGRMWKGTHLKVVANPTFWIQNPPRVFRQLTGTPWGTGTYEIDNTTPTVSSETLTLVEEIINFGIKLYNPSNSLVFSKTFYIAPA
jgi:hypothetical protein